MKADLPTPDKIFSDVDLNLEYLAGSALIVSLFAIFKVQYIYFSFPPLYVPEPSVSYFLKSV